MIRSLPLLVVAMALQGCASTVQSHQIGPGLTAGQPVDGVPFRVRDRMTLELYHKTDHGYELVNTQQETLADPSRLYVLNFSGQMLADASVKFEQLSDGSLSTVKVGGTPHAAEAVTAAATGVDALATTVTAIRASDKARDDQAKADAAARLAATDAAAGQRQSATELISAVRVLDQQLAELSDTAKASERLALEGQIAVAKLKARAAATRAGMDDPFP